MGGEANPYEPDEPFDLNAILNPSPAAAGGSSPASSVKPGGLQEQYLKDINEGWRDSADLGAAGMIDRDAQGWGAYLQQAAKEKGVAYDPSDLGDVIRNVSYAGNAGKDPMEFISAGLRKYDERANNIPGGGSNDDNGTNSSGTGGQDWISDYLKNLQGGQTDFGQMVQDHIKGLLDSGGRFNTSIVNQRRESAREGIDSTRRQQTAQARAALADRGLSSLPGVASGAEAGSILNLEELLAPVYAQSTRDIMTDELQQSSDRFMQALGLGGTSGQNEFENMLNTALAANTREKTLSDISLGALDRNIAWNSFLGRLNLDRDIAMNDSSDINSIMALLQGY